MLTGVLGGFSDSPTVQNEIYTDSTYGMDSVRKLLIWVIAADGPNDPDTPQSVA